MSRTQIAVRLAALVVVALLGVGFITLDVLGYHLGAQPFTVTVQLPRGGGLYADGFVTYRGVDVGRIASLSLDRQGAVATLAIDPDMHIPANAIAHVHELSVAGEQYLDLVPTSAQGPDLHAGSVIAEAHTNVPTSVYTLLNDAGQLIGSIKSTDVSTITAALGTGFANTGQTLRTIATAGQNLINALEAARAATVTLINGGGTVLGAAQASANDITSFSHSLQQFSAQLVASNADVQALLTKGAPTEAALNEVLQQDGTTLTAMIKDFATLSDVAISRQPAVVSLLQELPTFVNKIAATANGGSVAVQIFYNAANTVCPYSSSASSVEPTAATSTPVLDRTCPVSAPDLLQRGAANVPVSSGR